jgi:hypothetical protein
MEIQTDGHSAAIPDAPPARGESRLTRRILIGAAVAYVAVTFGAVRKLTWPADVEKQRRSTWSAADSTEVARFEGVPVVVEGYLTYDTRPSTPVAGGRQEKGETPNCGLTDAADVDWHIWFNRSPRRNRTRAVVVEMTPRVRAQHPGWSLAKLEAAAQNGRRVRVSGWLLLDQEHPEQIGKTRGTLWEIHPVMQFEVENDDGDFEPLATWTPSP